MKKQSKGLRLGRVAASVGVAIALTLAATTLAILAVSLSPTLKLTPPAHAENSVYSAKRQAMQPEAIRAIIQQAGQAWVTGNADAFAALFTTDGEFVVPGQRYQGTEAIRAVAAGFAATNSNVQVEIRRIIIDGDQAVVEWHWQDTETVTGKHSNADDAIVVDFQAGKISRWREYIDAATPQS
jgi:uncharacterized protein (TIGR02246 family)